jgi:hypothetical protein
MGLPGTLLLLVAHGTNVCGAFSPDGEEA